jgi:LytS/YehU family sensor histidine kinase
LNILIFGVTAGVLHAALYYRDLKARQLRESELEMRLARAELSALRTQLQPHFLFNALHTVSSLMVRDVPTAQRVVSALGDLLRTSLEHTARQEVSLREELAFVSRYLEIQQARYRRRLRVDIDVPDNTLDALVPSLVLQPLIENSIQHSIEPSPHGGTIQIRATRVSDRLTLSVRDDVAAAEDTRARPARNGIGLANIEARLAQLYADAHAFRAARDGDGHFVVTLTLPYHTDADLFPVAGHVR